MAGTNIWKNTQNILKDYGKFDHTRIQQHEETFINNPTRSAQDDLILYELFMNSLSVTGKSKVNVKPDEYHVGNPPLPSGLFLFKVLF